MSDSVSYEQPLNERIRTFLRLEFLFDTEDHYLANTSDWDSRICVSLLLDILDMLGRSDVKSELMKELERQSTVLSMLKEKPGVDLHRLEIILDDISEHLSQIRDKSYQPGQSIRQDELVSSIKQRSSIPGGSCNFDLPAYHYWLQRGREERNADLDRWRSDLAAIKNGIRLVLSMIRNSANPSMEQAVNGFYQKPMDTDIACQLIKIILPVNSSYFPEISGGKHRFTIRFLEQDSTTDRPVQSKETIDFELHCCVL